MSVGVCKDLLSVFTIVGMLNPRFWSSSNLRRYFLLRFCSRFVLAAISSSTCCHTFSCLLSSFKQPPHSPSVCISNYFWSGTSQHNIILHLRGDMIMLQQIKATKINLGRQKLITKLEFCQDSGINRFIQKDQKALKDKVKDALDTRNGKHLCHIVLHLAFAARLFFMSRSPVIHPV